MQQPQNTLVDGVKVVNFCDLVDFLVESPLHNTPEIQKEVFWYRVESHMIAALRAAHCEEKGVKSYFFSVPSERFALESILVQKWMKENNALHFPISKHGFFHEETASIHKEYEFIVLEYVDY